MGSGRPPQLQRASLTVWGVNVPVLAYSYGELPCLGVDLLVTRVKYGRPTPRRRAPSARHGHVPGRVYSVQHGGTIRCDATACAAKSGSQPRIQGNVTAATAAAAAAASSSAAAATLAHALGESSNAARASFAHQHHLPATACRAGCSAKPSAGEKAEWAGAAARSTAQSAAALGRSRRSGRCSCNGPRRRRAPRLALP